ncbi:MAG: hypothetical protein JWO33_20, partial [Caulobacteraceae bacterium]|nr:hypothetical protein [Caulobacteraceae bacterium]
MNETETTPARWKKAFQCPHCRAFAEQRWFKIFGDPASEPLTVFDAEKIKEIIAEKTAARDADESLKLYRHFLEVAEARNPLLDDAAGSDYARREFENMAASRCFACREFTLWLQLDVIYPLA